MNSDDGCENKYEVHSYKRNIISVDDSSEQFQISVSLSQQKS